MNSTKTAPKLTLCALLGVALVLGLGAAARAEEHAGEEHAGEEHAGEEHAGEEHAGEEHAGAHEAGGEHGGGHGAGHKVKHLDNWFSLSFGPGKKYQNGPFAFAILNFVLLLFILVKFARKPFREYLQTRHATIRDDLAEAAKMRDEARAKLAEIKSKLDNLEREISAIKEHVARDAQEEKDRIIKAAEEEAQRMIRAADKTLEKDLRRARRLLETEAVSAAMEAAEKLVKQQLNESDRSRLNEEYFEQIASSSPGGTN